tara:strand:- start:868 stop:1059 length:192 start_codon:yes stop_codon:yes gene_type:complete
MGKYKDLEATYIRDKKPENEGWYFVMYHTGKALAYYTRHNDRWRFVDGGWTNSDGILCWYNEV